MENKNLSEALKRVHALLEKKRGVHVFHTAEIRRGDREQLIRAGWLQEIIKGWYLFIKPDLRPGDSSGWYATFWDFLSVYLTHYYEQNYCLSAEQSLDLHLGVTVVPKQVIVMAQKGRGAPLELPFDTSLLIYASEDNLPDYRQQMHGLQIMSLPYALCKVSPTYFQRQPREAEIALQSIRRSDELLRVIISHNFVRAAGRLLGAYRFLGMQKMAEEILNGLAAVNIRVQETNPFTLEKPLIPNLRSPSPSAARILAMWHQYRGDVITHFPKPASKPIDVEGYFETIEEQYTLDAYHSLSIEGYRVSLDLIEKVRNAQWNPDRNEKDRKQQDALAARGYYEAFLVVKHSLEKIFQGSTPGEVAEADLHEWYRKLFAPCVGAGIIDPSELYGYRQNQVYIRNSRHVPLPSSALVDAMEMFFRCLREEDHPAVRAVLGHFIFVYIHPYMDGNGRVGRFLMNVMLASGGYPWTIVHVEYRKEYLQALESASVEENIVPFVQFLRESFPG